MNQYVNVSLSLLGLCGIVGAGVAIGSGVGMMALNVAQDQQEEGKQENVAVVAAHSPVETKDVLVTIVLFANFMIWFALNG